MKGISRALSLLSIFILSTSFMIFSNEKTVVVKDDIVYLQNLNEVFTSASGTDGTKLIYPLSWSTRTGSDGRQIAYPPGWTTGNGRDGRQIAYPIRWMTSTGTDGRKIAYPDSWSTIIGRDGRKIAFPFNWATATGTDGRLIAYPYNWTTATGTDGRMIAYPNNWLTTTGSDGRMIAYPYNWRIDKTARRTVTEVKEADNGDITLVFQQVENAEKIKDLIDQDKMDEAVNYALYLYANENY